MQTISHLVILASASRIRAALLEKVGLQFSVHPADINEDLIQDRYLTIPGPPLNELALKLSEEKARAVSPIYPGRHIIGADQLLVLKDEIFSKPETMAKAKTQLLQLRGQTHHLISAVSVVLDGEILWSHAGRVDMHMRAFSEAFLARYLENCGHEVVNCVGGYQLEGMGAQLFEAVKGDYFTVLGLPLIPLLAFLRTRKILVP